MNKLKQQQDKRTNKSDRNFNTIYQYTIVYQINPDKTNNQIRAQSPIKPNKSLSDCFIEKSDGCREEREFVIYGDNLGFLKRDLSISVLNTMTSVILWCFKEFRFTNKIKLT